MTLGMPRVPITTIFIILSFFLIQNLNSRHYTNPQLTFRVGFQHFKYIFRIGFYQNFPLFRVVFHYFPYICKHHNDEIRAA